MGNSIISRLREAGAIAKTECRRVEVAPGIELGIITPPPLMIKRASERARKLAEAYLYQTYGEAALLKFKDKPSDEAIEYARKAEAEKRGVDYEPFPNEYERMLSSEHDNLLIVELTPYMFVDPDDTSVFAAQTPGDVADLRLLVNQNTDVMKAFSEVMEEYGKQIIMSQDNKKKATKPRRTSKGSPHG